MDFFELSTLKHLQYFAVTQTVDTDQSYQPTVRTRLAG